MYFGSQVTISVFLLQSCYMVSTQFPDKIGRFPGNLPIGFAIYLCTYQGSIMKLVSDYEAPSPSQTVICNCAYNRKLRETAVSECSWNSMMSHIPFKA